MHRELWGRTLVTRRWLLTHAIIPVVLVAIGLLFLALRPILATYGY